MDILVSSNLERLLFLLSGDEQLVAKLMRQLSEDGAYEVPEELKEKIQSLFWAGCCGDDETKQTIGRVWREPVSYTHLEEYLLGSSVPSALV